MHELRPQIGLGPHQRFGLGEALGRAALHQVAGQGERATGEADNRYRLGQVAELGGDKTEGLLDEGGRDRAQTVEILGVPEGFFHHRPGARGDVDAEVDDGDDDVRKEHRRVHAVASDGLQGQLGGQSRVPHCVQDAPRPPPGAVLGQRTAGLAHEPYRRIRHGLAPARGKKRG